MTGVQRLLEVGLLISGAVSIFLFTALLTFNPVDPGWSQAGYTHEIQNAAGAIGAWCADILFFSFGLMAYVIPFLVMLAGYFAFYRTRHFVEIDYLTIGLRMVGLLLFIAGSAALFSLNVESAYSFSSGGILGSVVSSAMLPYFNVPGTVLLLLTFVLTGVTLITGLSWLKVIDGIGAWTITGCLWLYQFGRLKIQRLSKSHSYAEELKAEKTALLKESLENVQLEQQIGQQTVEGKVTNWHKLLFWRKNKQKLEPVNEVETESTDWEQQSVTETSLATATFTSGRLTATAETEPDIALASFSARDDEEPSLDSLPWPTTDEEAPMTLTSAAVASEPIQEERDPLPSLALLDRPNRQENPLSEEELDEISRTVETVLKDFGVEVQVAGVQPGPVITRFELDLAPGVKVSRISNLAKDIARSLSAIAVRVVEVIPGKSYVGLELPNKNREIVQLQEVLSCENFSRSESPLTMVLGKDIAGKPVVVDLARMPHLLVAGTTGSGKSVGVNAMILSLLYKSQPEDVRLIMIDPKMLELSVYEGIPHLLTEVVTDMKDAANALRWCVGEMERRYRLMSALGVRNIKGYNEKVLAALEAGAPLKNPIWKPGDSLDQTVPELEKLPYIVVVVDEFADMMMIVGKKVEELIARIAQKARAAGIHLILATQRPSVDVITGLIKANIPTRIAFQVSSKIDSRTILDQPGADQLLGQGDMLYLPPGSGVPTRVHGAFVDDHEVHAVVADWKARSQPRYLDEILNGDPNEDMLLPGEQSEEDAESDPLYDEAVAFVTERGRVSISSVQRQFRIGYNRAARIVEQMEFSGVVSSAGPGGARDVLAQRAPSIDY